jgi:excisionase family DNA binding protein
VGGVGRPSQLLDNAGVDEVEGVEPLPRNETNGGDGTASAERVAANLRRTEFLRPEGLLPVAAVAERLGLSASTVHEAINAGKLRAVLFGSVRRVRPEDLDAYVRPRSASRPPADEAWCTVADLMRLTGYSRAHAYRLLERRAVPFAVFAGTRYIRKGTWSAPSAESPSGIRERAPRRSHLAGPLALG